MSREGTCNEHATAVGNAGTVETKRDVVLIPVSDVDRAKRFYAGLAWRLDGDLAGGYDWRVVQLSLTGSTCSVIFGAGRDANAECYRTYASFSDPDGNGWLLQESRPRLPDTDSAPTS